MSRRLLAVTALTGILALAACVPHPASAPNEAAEASRPAAPETEARLVDRELRDAAWDDDVARAAKLIAEGADVNAKDDTVQSAYLIATSEGYLDLLRLTLENGAKVDDKDSWNGTGLIRAAERGHGYVVGELLQARIDRDHVNRIGFQAIHEAVIFGEDTETYHLTVRALIAGGVEFDRPSDGGDTPLEMAQSQVLKGTERILVAARDGRAPADPSAALLAAAQSGDADAAMLAIRAGADLETRDADQRTPLFRAVMEDNVPVAQLLVALGADVDAFDSRRDTPWVMTGVTGSVRMLDALLPGQPDLSIPNRRGGTPANPAAERGHADYIDRIVQLGIDLDRVNLNGWTALLEAVVFGGGTEKAQRIVRTLLEAGADPTIEDAEGRTALENARRLGYSEVARILEG